MVLIAILTGSAPAIADWQNTLIPDPLNPIFDPSDPGDRVYYQTVLYDVNGFGNGAAGPFYRMWYSDGHTVIAAAESDDGIIWTETGDGVGLTNPHHSQVVYDSGGFGNGGAGPFYKIWYWDTTKLYSIDSIRTAESNDGSNWVNDQAIANDPLKPIIVTQVPKVAWNSGTYGPVNVFYHSSAANSGTDPFNYSYTMYFDATTGAFEETGLGYSVDGITWSLYQDAPVLPRGVVAGQWDQNYASFGSVVRDQEGLWHFWYSGGVVAMGDGGIGYASSPDGINWTKSPSNPFIAPVPGTWENTKPYTPQVLYDINRYSGHGNNSQYKMWHAGVSAGGNYTLGYYGRDVAIVTVEQLPTIPASQNFTSDTQTAPMIELKLTNNNVEPVTLSGLTIGLAGSLLDSGEAQKILAYEDLNGNGKVDPADPLLAEVAAANGAILSFTLGIAQASSVSIILVASLSADAAITGDLTITFTSNDIDAAGDETKEAQLDISTDPTATITREKASPPTPPTPPPEPPNPPDYGLQGSGKCSLIAENGIFSSTPLIMFLLTVGLIAGKRRFK
jgi:hypothetical protein